MTIALSPTPAVSSKNFSESFHQLAGERRRLLPGHLLVISSSVTHCVRTGIRTHSNLIPLYDDLEALSYHVDMSCVTHLKTYAEALGWAEEQWQLALEPPAELPAVVAEATHLRKVLRSDFYTQICRGRANKMMLTGCTWAAGARAVANDLLILAGVFREMLPRIEGESSVWPSDLERAEALSEQIFEMVGTKNEVPRRVQQAADDRARAYTVFVRVYEQIRRAVVFLRWFEGDAEVVAPSLYLRRNGRVKEKTWS